jgi:hypothetical protein
VDVYISYLGMMSTEPFRHVCSVEGQVLVLLGLLLLNESVNDLNSLYFPSSMQIIPLD